MSKTTIGQFLKQWRERRNFSQDDVASLTKNKGKGKWTKSYISLVENDRPSQSGTPPRPSPEKLKAICDILGAPFEDAMRIAYGVHWKSKALTKQISIEDRILSYLKDLPEDRRIDLLIIAKALHDRYSRGISSPELIPLTAESHPELIGQEAIFPDEVN